MPIFAIQLDATTLLPESRATGLGVGDILAFQELPDGLAVSKDAHYHDEQIPGRTEPPKSYVATGPRRISFSVKFLATGFAHPIPVRFVEAGIARAQTALAGIGASPAGLPGGDAVNAGLIYAEVHRPVAWLEALTHAQYDEQGRAFPPPAVWLIYGFNFVRRGVVVSASPTYHGPWHPETKLCMRVDVNIVFEEQNLRPPSYEDARSGIIRQLENKYRGSSRLTSSTTLARRAFGG